MANAICKVLPIAPSTYHHHQAVKRDPSKGSLRAQRDTELGPKIKACWEASGKRHGAVKVWYDLAAEGKNIARCTVVRLMKEMGIQGLRHWARTVAHRARTDGAMMADRLNGSVRGKGKKTTYRDPAQPCPEDKVNRDFRAPAPNVLWGDADQRAVRGTDRPRNDFTYVRTAVGFVYVALDHCS